MAHNADYIQLLNATQHNLDNIMRLCGVAPCGFKNEQKNEQK